MIRRQARAFPAVLVTTCLYAVLAAGPALAANGDLGPREGAETSSGLSTVETLVLFVLLPFVLVSAVAALVWLPGMVKADRYRPQRGWTARPVWFAGPPDPVAAVETADASSSARGGAGGSW